MMKLYILYHLSKCETTDHNLKIMDDDRKHVKSVIKPKVQGKGSNYPSICHNNILQGNETFDCFEVHILRNLQEILDVD